MLTSPPMPVQDELLAETLDQMDTIEPIISAMVVAWLSGDDREFRRLFDLENGDSPKIIAFMPRLLEDRNVRWRRKSPTICARRAPRSFWSARRT